MSAGAFFAIAPMTALCYNRNMNLLKKLLRWLPALFIFGCSWYLSSQETIEHMPGFWNADKVVHGICFAGLTFWVAFGVGTKLPLRWRILLPVIIVSLYGFLDEFHQSFTPGRETSVLDWCADTVGAIIGSIVFFYVCKWIGGRVLGRPALGERGDGATPSQRAEGEVS